MSSSIWPNNFFHPEVSAFQKYFLTTQNILAKYVQVLMRNETIPGLRSKQIHTVHVISTNETVFTGSNKTRWGVVVQKNNQYQGGAKSYQSNVDRFPITAHPETALTMVYSLKNNVHIFSKNNHSLPDT